MKLLASVTLLVATAVFAVSCDSAPSPAAAPAAGSTAATAGSDEVEKANAAPTDIKAGTALANGAPPFASLYPDAVLDQPVLTAVQAGRPGGIAQFTTSASATEVIHHYRQLADNDGLQVVMQMDQGNARAFSARSVQGAELQVVASPVDGGDTSVQLTWQADQ